MSDYARLQRDGWQRVACKYEDAWAGLTRLFIDDLLDAGRISRGERVLDVACGPGYVAERARERDAEAIGIDFSSEMIRIARDRRGDIDFRVGDAQALEFDAAGFDAVVSNFGVIHLPDPAAGLAEARRVLRRGGRLAFTVWAGPEGSAGGRLMDSALRAHGDMNVDLPTGPDTMALADPVRCRALLAGAGFDPASVTFRAVTHGWRVPTASHIFELERDAGVRTAAVLAKQTPRALDAIQRDIESGMQQFAAASGYVVPYTAHIISASAPG